MGIVAWSNTGNVASSNDSYATASLGSAIQTNYLKVTGFSFTIPGGSTIEGIKVEIEHKGSVADVVKDYRVRIVKDYAIGSTDKASATNWPTSDAYQAYGSDSDLWGETWTPAQINSFDNFGVAISALGLGIGTASIDHIRVTVYYA